MSRAANKQMINNGAAVMRTAVPEYKHVYGKRYFAGYLKKQNLRVNGMLAERFCT